MTPSEGTVAGDTPEAPAAGPSREGAPSEAYGFYVVGVLMVAYMFSFIDRTLLSLVIDPIRKDLGLSETQISLLVGFAFAAFYTLLGLPFGRWVDTRGRRNLIAIGIALWSVATVFCGLATSFWRLFFARMAVGVGEATLSPAAYSIIPDYFTPKRLGFAMGVYSCGVTLGGGLAMLLGGLVVQWAATANPVLPVVGQVAAWKVPFLVVGLPGLIVALVVFTTVREPPRRLEKGGAASVAPKISEVVGYLWRNKRVYAPLFAGFSAIVIAGYAFNVWGPAYFMRVHGYTPAGVGVIYGIGFALFGTLGVLSGGAISDRFAAKGALDAPIRVSMWSAVIQAPLFVGAYLAPAPLAAAALFIVALFFGSIYGGLQAAAIQALTPNRMRGQVAALYLTIANMIGLGLAPTWTAWMTEHVFGGPKMVGVSLAVTTVVSLSVGVLLLALAMKPARRQMEQLL
ncbi:MFS transporter [Phenylobacterium sp. J426]|uniref:spinster family MFS transporter n=1 Tax=Phenylobacterium sp. J426 TaxID=2898439 RepID=UPI002151EFA9|nr:MFS transporter [Phenylobacterium sp. J426]MCR5872719.1 MFS transporter [Phenylobacterium sp. J426]MCR5876471.1 MFS transporter [Phenylobacterium sp. J426]